MEKVKKIVQGYAYTQGRHKTIKTKLRCRKRDDYRRHVPSSAHGTFMAKETACPECQRRTYVRRLAVCSH